MGREARLKRERNHSEIPKSSPREPRFTAKTTAAAYMRSFVKKLGLHEWERRTLRDIRNAKTREYGDEIFSANATPASEFARIKWLRALETLPSAFDIPKLPIDR